MTIKTHNYITSAGGKWTTYRRMAEDVVDHAEMIGALDHRLCVTQNLAIHGSAAQAGDAGHHLACYGSDAEGIRALTDADPSLGDRIHPKLEHLHAEVIWHVRHEMARTVEDVLARRTRALLLDARAASESAEAVARRMAAELGRDESWIVSQIQSFQALAAGYMLR